MIAQHLTIGFEERRERSESRCDGKQVGGAFALLPQRGPHAWPAAWKEQRARGRLPETRGKERSRSKLPQHQRFHVLDVGNQQHWIGWVFALGKTDDETLVS